MMPMLVLDRDELLARGLRVALGAPEAGQDQGGSPGDQVRAVELGGDLGGQRAAAAGASAVNSVSGVADEEVAAQAEEAP